MAHLKLPPIYTFYQIAQDMASDMVSESLFKDFIRYLKTNRSLLKFRKFIERNEPILNFKTFGVNNIIGYICGYDCISLYGFEKLALQPKNASKYENATITVKCFNSKNDATVSMKVLGLYYNGPYFITDKLCMIPFERVTEVNGKYLGFETRQELLRMVNSKDYELRTFFKKYPQMEVSRALRGLAFF